MGKGHCLWPWIWLGCPKNAMSKIKVGRVLSGKGAMTHVKSLTSPSFTLVGPDASDAPSWEGCRGRRGPGWSWAPSQDGAGWLTAK